jgi:hypothetical protein
MKSALRRAALFTAVPLGLAVLADLLLAVFYQGAQPHELRQQMLVIHGALFASIAVMCAVGAFVGFLLQSAKAPSTKAVLLAALLFAVVSFFAVVIAFGLGGPVALGAWLFFGAAAFAAGSGITEGRQGA